MNDKIMLTKVMLTTKEGADISLSLAEAKDLYEQLRQLFEQKPVFVPSVPIIIERNRWPERSPYDPIWVSCSISNCAQSGYEV